MAVLSKLLEICDNGLGYTTYVFQLLEKSEIDNLGTKYIMCTRHPNWDHRELNKNEIGYLEFKEVKAGVDTWFNGVVNKFYNYDDVQFIKFIEKTEDNDEQIIL